MPSNNLTDAQRERILFLEERLFWLGSVTKTQVVEKFHVSARTAQSDFQIYQHYFPNSIARIGENSPWSATSDFEPKYYQPSAEQFLSSLALENGLSVATQVAGCTNQLSWIDASPELGRINKISVNVLRGILRSIAANNKPPKKQKLAGGLKELLVVYRSPNSVNEASFWIGPHALTHDSFRWAIRCWRTDYARYGDIVLDRIIEIRDERGTERNYSKDDAEWNLVVTVEIRANPLLDNQARSHIERQYGMERGLIRVKIRKASLVYFLKRYQLEEESALKAPHQQPIVIANRAEITLSIPPHMRIPPE